MRLAVVAAGLMEAGANLRRRAPAITRQEIKSMLVRTTYDGSKARSELGFTPPVDLAEGMQRVAEWVGAHPEFLAP